MKEKKFSTLDTMIANLLRIIASLLFGAFMFAMFELMVWALRGKDPIVMPAVWEFIIK